MPRVRRPERKPRSEARSPRARSARRVGLMTPLMPPETRILQQKAVARRNKNSKTACLTAPGTTLARQGRGVARTGKHTGLPIFPGTQRRGKYSHPPSLGVSVFFLSFFSTLILQLLKATHSLTQQSRKKKIPQCEFFFWELQAIHLEGSGYLTPSPRGPATWAAVTACLCLAALQVEDSAARESCDRRSAASAYRSSRAGPGRGPPALPPSPSHAFCARALEK